MRKVEGLELHHEVPENGAGSAQPGVHLEPSPDARLVFALSASVGHRAEVTMGSGACACGVLFAISSSQPPRSNLLLTLRAARLTHSEQGIPTRSSSVFPFAVVSVSKLRSLSVRDVELSDVARAHQQHLSSHRNSSSGGGIERELVHWSPAENEQQLDASLDSAKPSKQSWDQFAANESKFGVQSTYDERKYTTEVDKSSANISEERAARIAREITQNGVASTCSAAAETAGEEVDINEEETFSAVQRTEEATPSSASTAADNGSVKSSEPSTPKSPLSNKLNPKAKSFNPNTKTFTPNSGGHLQQNSSSNSTHNSQQNKQLTAQQQQQMNNGFVPYGMMMVPVPGSPPYMVQVPAAQQAPTPTQVMVPQEPQIPQQLPQQQFNQFGTYEQQHHHQ